MTGRTRALVIGHRGAAALAPENTLASIEAALAAGVDMVEVDVLPLADGTLALAHSDDLLEVTHGRAEGRVGDRGLDELRAVEPRVATLDEALALLEASPGTEVLLDVKQPGHEGPLVDAVRRRGMAGRAVVSSFFPETLAAVAALEPGLRRALSYPLDRRRLSRHRRLRPVVLLGVLVLRVLLPFRIGRRLERAGAQAATLHWLLCSRRVIRRCHARGAPVYAWTVDDARAARHLIRAGADGIITNDPRVVPRLP